ncbi:MAG: tryptophan--tRNA ligase [Candidatus Gastranaerophilales bacterium]|nr:tryptophan--tRNA ligase [Candidatus Gastranaerophilales bacterium]
MENKQRIMSGMRPTGKLHLGHYLGVLKNWVNLQNDYECYFSIADWHALTTKYNQTEDMKQNVQDVLLDWLCAGVDPNKSTIYLQSLVPQTASLHIYLSMITPQNWVERDPTLKDLAKIMKEKQENISNLSYGLFGYPVLMTADILTFNAQLVPVGIDQVAHVELSRDIARRFNNTYGVEYFFEPQPKLTQVPLLKGLDGNKMGKSFNNDIKLADSAEITQKKIMSGITDRNRIRKDDKGNPDNCEVIFDYWKIFGSEEEIACVCDGCKNATMGCAECKRKLAAKINENLAPLREERIELESNISKVHEILHEGSKKAQIKAQEVLDGAIDVIKMYK